MNSDNAKVMKQIGKIFCWSTFFFSPLLLAAPRMPWDDSLQVVMDSLTGTTAHIIIIIAIAISGLMWAIGDQGGIINKAGKVIFGGSIATGAVSICSALKLVGGGF